MKPEKKFEEFVRQKLESVQPPFQEEAWDRFVAYQKIHTAVPFWRHYGSRILYTAATMAGAVLVFANVYQYKHNKDLNEKIVVLEQQLEQKARENPVEVRIDTVYIDRYITTETSSFTQPKLSNNSVPNDQTLPEEISTSATQNSDEDAVVDTQPTKSQETIANKKEQIEQKGDNNRRGVEVSKENKVEKEGNRIATHLTDKIVKVPNSSSSKVEEESVLVGNSKGGRSRQVNSERVVNQNFDKQSVDVRELGLEDVNNAYNNSNGTQSTVVENIAVAPILPTPWQGMDIKFISHEPTWNRLATVEPAVVEIKRYGHLRLPTHSTAALVATETKSNKTSKTNSASPPPSVSFKNMKFRVGAGINIGDKYLAYSANSSLLLGKYWSLDVGLKHTEIKGPQFFTEDNFREKVQKEFQEWRKDEHPSRPPLARPQILNIQTKANLLQMPISLTYRWPLQDGFTILFSGGTHLNLSVEQQYDYKYKEPNGEFEEKEGKFTVKPPLTNDVIIAGGIEKQWRNLVAQFETYANPYIKTPSYLSENRNLGVRLKLLYQFGKIK